MAMCPDSAHWALEAMSSMMRHADCGIRTLSPCKVLWQCKAGFEAHHLTDDKFAALGRALEVAILSLRHI